MDNDLLDTIWERLATRLMNILHCGFPLGEEQRKLVNLRSEEYKQDRLSVPPEWREIFDDLMAYNFIDGQRFQSKKDDEAFRFFLDEPDA